MSQTKGKKEGKEQERQNHREAEGREKEWKDVNVNKEETDTKEGLT